METRASGMTGRFPFTTAAPQQTAVAYIARAFSLPLSHNKITEYRWCENKLCCYHSFIFWFPCSIRCNPVFSRFQYRIGKYDDTYCVHHQIFCHTVESLCFRPWWAMLQINEKSGFYWGFFYFDFCINVMMLPPLVIYLNYRIRRAHFVFISFSISQYVFQKWCHFTIYIHVAT